jgi:predicted acetyltransferase
MWIRLVDLAAALRMRRYASPVDLVVEVTDEQLPGNSGRWRLRSDGLAGPAATCERTTAPAQLALDIASLGAAYLGGTKLGSMAAAGLATELEPGAILALSAALAWDPLPWAPMMF